MGQYYLIVNTAKRQYLYPPAFKDARKLLEFGASSAGVMLGLAILLADGNGRGGGGDLHSKNPLIGSWAGDPLVIAGEYADDGKHVPALDAAVMVVAHGEAPNLYEVASTCYEDISERVIAMMCDDPYTRKALIERGVEAALKWPPDATG